MISKKKLDDQELRPLLNKWKTVDGKLIISSD